MIRTSKCPTTCPETAGYSGEYLQIVAYCRVPEYSVDLLSIDCLQVGRREFPLILTMLLNQWSACMSVLTMLWNHPSNNHSLHPEGGTALDEHDNGNIDG